MSSVLPFDIIAQIIDSVGQNNDTNLLKELALVSHSFHHICSKYLFATIELHDADPICHLASSKKGFIKLLESRPGVVKHIRKLTYKVGEYCRFQPFPGFPSFENEDQGLSPILPNLLRTISRLNFFIIIGSNLVWNSLDPCLTSAFFYLMRLPTINHIDLSLIHDFPLSSFTPSVSLRRLDISHLWCFDDRLEEESSPEIVIQSEIIPKIREFHTSASPLLTTKLLHAKKQDGQPAFNFADLTQLSTSLEDEWNLRYLSQNAKLLEKLHLSSIGSDQSLARLYDILSPSSRTLKVLDISVSIYDSDPLPLSGLCEGLEAMAGHNTLEALSFEVFVDQDETEDSIGSEVQGLEKVLLQPGWSALRQVSLKVTISCWGGSAGLYEALVQSFPDIYLSRLSKLKSVAFNFSVDIHKFMVESPD